VAGDEKGIGTDGIVSGRLLEGLKLMRGSHLLAYDRTLCAHAHIRAMKSGLEIPFFWA
jgi:hypothetical protein